jgi:hypothetical protein
MKTGWYVLRIMPTKEWPYVTTLIVIGPCETTEEINRRLMVEQFQFEYKVRRWDGEKWSAS